MAFSGLAGIGAGACSQSGAPSQAAKTTAAILDIIGIAVAILSVTLGHKLGMNLSMMSKVTIGLAAGLSLYLLFSNNIVPLREPAAEMGG